MKGPRDDCSDDEEINVQPSKSTAENKVKVGQIFTDEEYDSLKKVANDNEKSDGIDWGFGNYFFDFMCTSSVGITSLA